MDSKELSLKKDVLGNLCLRVAKTLPCLKVMDDSTMWNQPIELCKRIEANIREVDNVILEVNKNRSYFQNTSANPLNSEVMLARVYILLYYLHHDDKDYQTLVFHELQKHMGIYQQKLLNDIQSKIKNIVEMDKLLERSREEKRKNSKPKFRMILLSDSEADENFSIFLQERLFSQLSNSLEQMRETYFEKYDVTSIWLTAKDVVKKLWMENAPEHFVERIYRKLSQAGNGKYAETGAAEAVFYCAYAMMRSVDKSDHFHKTITYIEDMLSVENDYDLLEDEFPTLKQQIDEGGITFDEYDYTGGGAQVTPEAFSKADVEEMLSGLHLLLEQYKKQLEAKDTELAAKDHTLKAQEAEIAELRTHVLQHKQMMESQEQTTSLQTEMQRLEEENQQMKEEKDEMIIEILTCLFKKEEGQEAAKAFLNEIKGQDDVGVTDVVCEYKKKFSPRINKTYLWNVLHAAKLYNKSDRNFATALRTRGWS